MISTKSEGIKYLTSLGASLALAVGVSVVGPPQSATATAVPWATEAKPCAAVADLGERADRGGEKEAPLAIEQAFVRAEGARTPTQFAQLMAPDDPALRQEILAALSDYEAQTQQAIPGQSLLPAALVPVVAIVGRCVVGALGSAGVNEVISLVKHGKQASAEARIDAAIGGCITSVVPPLLRPIARKARPALVAAVLRIVVAWGPK